VSTLRRKTDTAEEAKPFAYRWKYVIVAATGRSGSTNLLRYLNTVPGFHLTGENNNALFGLLRMRKTLQEMDKTEFVKLQRTQYLEPHTRKGPWYNTFDVRLVFVSVMLSAFRLPASELS